MSGLIQQLVWPYMVSGRSVAATKNTFLPANCAIAAGSGSMACICTMADGANRGKKIIR